MLPNDLFFHRSPKKGLLARLVPCLAYAGPDPAPALVPAGALVHLPQQGAHAPAEPSTRAMFRRPRWPSRRELPEPVSPPELSLTRLLGMRRDVDYSGLRLGPVFAEGSFKNAHEVLRRDGRPSGYVLVIEKSIHSYQIPGEVARLAFLAERGFPVADIVSTGFYLGHSAMLMPRCLGMIKPGIVWQPEMLAKFLRSPHVSRHTVEDLQLILWSMKKYHLRIIDAQMLLDPRSGRLQLSDPLGILPGRTLAQVFPGQGPYGGAVQPLHYVLDQLYRRFPDMAPG